jgi:membrane-bound ClpP family serine protease
MWIWYLFIAALVLLIIFSIVKKLQEKKKDVNPLEKYLNTEAVVTEAISDTLGKGKVSLDGNQVDAYRGKPGVIDPGTKVRIIEFGLQKVKVEPIEAEQPAEPAPAEPTADELAPAESTADEPAPAGSTATESDQSQ